jgi:hypothetical protein
VINYRLFGLFLKNRSYIIFIHYGRELKNYFGKRYVYLKDFSYFSNLYNVMDE